jgi:hypothetical protein
VSPQIQTVRAMADMRSAMGQVFCLNAVRYTQTRHEASVICDGRPHGLGKRKIISHASR